MSIKVYFGSPGCGKTTSAVALMCKAKKHYKYVMCNFEVSPKIAREIDLTDLGLWTPPPNTYLAIDEAGIEYNSRKFKTLSQDTIRWFKLHRHYGCDVSVWSQSWDDMDITLRRLADELWLVKKIGCFTLLRRVYKRVTVDKQTEQIIDGYRMTKVLAMLIPFWGTWRIVFRPRWYKHFNSWSTPETPIRYAD